MTSSLLYVRPASCYFLPNVSVTNSVAKKVNYGSQFMKDLLRGIRTLMEAVMSYCFCHPCHQESTPEGKNWLLRPLFLIGKEYRRANMKAQKVSPFEMTENLQSVSRPLKKTPRNSTSMNK